MHVVIKERSAKNKIKLLIIDHGEVHAALDSFSDCEALGIYGFNSNFYKKYWNR